MYFDNNPQNQKIALTSLIFVLKLKFITRDFENISLLIIMSLKSSFTTKCGQTSVIFDKNTEGSTINEIICLIDDLCS